MGAKYINSFLEGKISDTDFLHELRQSNNIVKLDYPQLSVTEAKVYLTEDVRKLLTDNIDDMYQKSIYGNVPGVHSTKHIEDVMLFATIIGRTLNIENHDLQLLIEAAKYHDSGRIRDYDKKDYSYKNSDELVDRHGIASAKKAREELAGKYSEEDIKVIAIAIELHVPRLNAQLIEELCQKYNVDTKDTKLVERITKLSLALKDADALDRTRFRASTSQFTNSDYLYLKISKSLIQIGAQINEKYAVDDINALKQAHPELISLLDEKLELTDNPKEVIRAYRKGYLETLEKDYKKL